MADGSSSATASATEHDAVLRDYEELWEGDFSKLDVVSESVVLVDPASPEGEIRGRDALEERIRTVTEAFPDFHAEVHDQLARDGTVMMEWTMYGTHEGEYDGIPPTGEEMAVSGMSKVVVADGKIAEDRLYFDTRTMMGQLGLVEE